MSEKHVYKVTEGSSDRSLGYWLAKDAEQAKRAALIHVTAKRLTGGEVVNVTVNGYAISDAEATLARAGQPDLPFEQHDPAPAIAQAEEATE